MRLVDLPEALPDGGRFLHIGMPKTGTTALQGALDDARDRLEELGAHNVSPVRHAMEVGQTAAGTLPVYWRGRAHWEARWDELAADFVGSTARCTFWSSEALSQANAERVQYLADRLGRDTRIVLTLRPLGPLLVSQWQQVLRRRGTDALDVWLRKQFDAVRPDGTVVAPWGRFMPQIHRFSLRRVIDEWGAAFGQENLVLIVPAPDDRVGTLRAFESLMGVPEVLRPPAEGNASLPFPEAEMLRAFNNAYTERGGDHGTWMHVVSRLGRTGLRELAGRAKPHRIEAPRWAVELGNTYTADWIHAVQESEVTVVGDLDHLLVDPAAFPADVAAPTHVSVETAGRLVDVALAAALEYGERQAPSAPAPPADLSAYSGRALLREVGRRVRSRLRP